MNVFKLGIISKARSSFAQSRILPIGYTLAVASCIATLYLALRSTRIEPGLAQTWLSISICGLIALLSMPILRLYRDQQQSKHDAVTASVTTVEAHREPPAEPAPTSKSFHPDEAFAHIGVDYMTVALSTELAEQLLLVQTDDALREKLHEVRREIARETGIVLPGIHIRDDIFLDPFTVQIAIRDEVVSTLNLKESCLLAIGSDKVLTKLQGEIARGLVYQFNAKWIALSDEEYARSIGALLFDHTSIIISLVGQTARDHLWKSFGRQEFHALLNHLRKQTPAILDTLEQLHVPFDVLHNIWKALLLEGVWPRDPVTVMESILTELERNRASVMWLYNCSSWGRTIAEYHEVIEEIYNPAKLAEAVRKSLVPIQLRRTYGTFEQSRNSVKYIVFSSALTKRLAQFGEREQWSLLDVALSEHLVRELNHEYQSNRVEFIKCEPANRILLSRILNSLHCRLSVYASDEIPRDIRTEHYATLTESGLELSVALPDFPSDVVYEQFQTFS